MLFQTRRRSLLCAALCAIFLGGISAAQQPYRILNTWKLSDAGWWDYLTVDSAAHRLYITRGDHVDVLNTADGKQLATISGLHGIHGVALDTAGKYGYISDGTANAVVVFDRATFATVATLSVGTGPDSIIFEPATQTVWAFNGRSKNATVIDAATQKVVATIARGAWIRVVFRWWRVPVW